MVVRSFVGLQGTGKESGGDRRAVVVWAERGGGAMDETFSQRETTVRRGSRRRGRSGGGRKARTASQASRPSLNGSFRAGRTTERSLGSAEDPARSRRHRSIQKSWCKLLCSRRKSARSKKAAPGGVGSAAVGRGVDDGRQSGQHPHREAISSLLSSLFRAADRTNPQYRKPISGHVGQWELQVDLVAVRTKALTDVIMNCAVQGRWIRAGGARASARTLDGVLDSFDRRSRRARPTARPLHQLFSRALGFALPLFPRPAYTPRSHSTS